MSRYIAPLKSVEYGVYGDLTIIYPRLYSIYLRRTIKLKVVRIYGGFPKIRDTFLGVPMIRTIVF